MPHLAASAMNALAHAVEVALRPVRATRSATMAALRAAELFASGLARGPADREDLALGVVLAGYAVGRAGFAVHHAVCQTHRARARHAARGDQRRDAAAQRPHVVARRGPRRAGRASGRSDAIAAGSQAPRARPHRLVTLGVGRTSSTRWWRPWSRTRRSATRRTAARRGGAARAARRGSLRPRNSQRMRMHTRLVTFVSRLIVACVSLLALPAPAMAAALDRPGARSPRTLGQRPTR